MGKRNIFQEKEETESNEELKYQFMREQIRPQRKQRFYTFVEKMVGAALLALVFGALAGIAFGAVSDMFGQGDMESQDAILQSQGVPSSLIEETEEPEEEASASADPEDARTVIENYKRYCSSSATIGKVASQAIVSVSGNKENNSWYDIGNTGDNQQCGVIFRETTSQIYILVCSQNIENAKSIEVVFPNSDSVAARITGGDASIGIVVLSIDKEELDRDTKESIRVLQFGGASNLTTGTPIIALGSPNGIMHSVEFGNIVNDDLAAMITDGQISLYCSNICFAENSSGFVINLKGRMIGILSTGFTDVTGTSCSAFIGISKIRTVIDRLASGKESVYLGIKGCNASEDKTGELPIGKGVYITNVIAQSPAYQGELRVADIITRIDDTQIDNLQELQQCLMKYEVGDKVTVYINRISGKKNSDRKMKVTLK